MIDPARLGDVPLLRALNAGARRELAAHAVVRSLAPGSVLWHAGDEPRGLWFVLEGEIRVIRTSATGRQHVIHSEEAGGTVGEVPFFEGGRYPATAMASRRARCLVVNRDGVTAAIREDPELAWLLLARLCGRVRTLIARLDAVSVLNVRARLAGYLLLRHARCREESFALGCTQLELAEELGTVREVVVRELRGMRQAGVIATERGRFRVLDLERLRHMAGEPGGAGRPGRRTSPT